MPDNDIVVVGGGCVGLASAIALARTGAGVILVESGLPGAESSTRTGGGIRQQFGTELNIRLSQLSADTWETFGDQFGVDPMFSPIGYLFLARSPESVASLTRNVALQRSLGVDSELLDADELERRWRPLADRGFRGASFRANDGWANHHRIIEGLVQGASAAGVRILTGTEALTIEMSGGRLAGISTTGERIAADAALVATGPWVEPLLGPLGLGVPVVGRRHELLIVDTSGSSPAGLPWLIDVEEQVHTRGDAPGRALVGGFLGEDRAADPDRYDRRAGRRWTELVLDHASSAFGVVGPNARIRHGWAGLYPSTPDHHPIIDELADGLFVSMGFSGTGLMHAPAAGRLAAELIVGRRITSVDPATLSAGRFARIGRVEATGF